MTKYQDASTAFESYTSETFKANTQPESLFRVTLLGLSGQQVVPSAAMAAGCLPLYAGNGSWLAMLLALAAALFMSMASNVFARKHVVTGSLISYVGLSLGRMPQRVVAASYLTGFLIVCAALSASVVMFSSSFLHSVGVPFAASNWFQAASAITLSVLAGALTWRGLDASISITAWLSFLSAPLVSIVAVTAAMDTGVDLTAQLTLQGVSWQSLAQGTIVGLAYFVGCDALAALAAETAEPKKNVPKLIRNVLLITGFAFTGMLLLTTHLMSSQADALNAGQSPTAIMANIAGMSYLQKPIDLLLTGAAFASLVAFMNYGSRVFATSATEKFLPSVFSSVHPEFGSPTAATILMATSAAIIPLALQVFAGAPPILSANYLSTLFSLFWIIPYVLLSIAAIKEIIKSGEQNLINIPAIAIGGLTFAVILAYYFMIESEGVFAWLPYIMIIMTAVAYGVLVALERSQAKHCHPAR
ncbi:APC family permease [Pseudomonas sp. DR48]|uniref:APC family permease n=1 Tax=Pseudomonas sp. DR48 TaxID=2871095 RepID=UPI001C99987B|nr:APC family permease [Pseudomonas sp. DR48]QZP30459.1 APC family permease [Pseudomonas sp. DR48]